MLYLGKSTPPKNVIIETPPVITFDVIRPVSTAFVTALDRFIFFTNLSPISISSNKYASISVNFLSDVFVALVFFI